MIIAHALSAKLLILCLGFSAHAQLTLDIKSANDCDDDEYFDSTVLTCERCPLNAGIQDLVPTSDQLACECKPGFHLTNGVAGSSFFPECEACGNNTGVSEDKTTCMSCLSPAFFDPEINDCRCPYLFERDENNADRDGNQQDYWYVVERNLGAGGNGELLQDAAGNFNKICQVCSKAGWQGPNRGNGNQRAVTVCQNCGPGQKYDETVDPFECICDELTHIDSGGVCISKDGLEQLDFDIERAYEVKYNSVEFEGSNDSQTTQESGVFKDLYLKSVMGCKQWKNPKDCQTLANLCVLVFYDMQNREPCQQFKAMVDDRDADINPDEFYNDQGWVEDLPWLYYHRDRTATEIIEQPKRVKLSASFDYENKDIGILTTLEFKLAKYNIVGEFLGFEPLTDQLVICEKSWDQVQRIFRIGTSVEISCTFDLGNLVSELSYDRPRLQNIFFELYLVDYNGDLIDVPVRIDNQMDGARQTNNKNDSEVWLLTRRFFLFDTISGIQPNDYPDGLPTIVRYPKEISLSINLDDIELERINVPVLYIKYKERNTEEIYQNPLTVVSFKSEYKMSMDNIETYATWGIWIASILTALLSIGSFVDKWSRPALTEDNRCVSVFIKSFINLMDYFSRIFFYFFFGFLGTLFVFYKMQERVFCFMPGIESATEYYDSFEWFFIFMVIAKIIYMLFKIAFEQCVISVYLIDWERPKPHRFDKQSKVDVNAWRSILLMNELNEMQTYRLISSEFTLIMYGLFMQGYGLKYWDSHDPDLNVTQTNSPRNFALFFFVTTIVIYTIGLLQYALIHLCRGTKPLRTEEFVDLCSVCNISILMFDDTFQGHYIHGISPYGYAEISAERLRKSLEFEATGKAQVRGISQDDPNLQTFEIFMPRQLMMQYTTNMLLPQRQKINNQLDQNQKSANAAVKAISLNAAIPPDLKIEELDNERKIMNKLMMRYVEQVRAEPSRYIRDRSPFERFKNSVPKEVNENKPIMFRDPWYSYGKHFLLGMDFDFLMLEVCVLSLMNQLFRDVDGMDVTLLMGILIAYLIDCALISLRAKLGSRNFATHTLTDEKFLV